jgi:hypothetical protein
MLVGSLLAIGIPVLAAPITGIVNVNGVASVVGNTINFYGGAACDAPGTPPSTGCFTASAPRDGIFTGLTTNAVSGTIEDLVGPPYSGNIALADFMVFAGIGVHFDLKYILAGGAPDCTTVVGNAPGVQCTPVLAPGPGGISPFVITNNAPAGGGPATSSSVFFNVYVDAYTGTKASGSTEYIGTFSTPSSGRNIAQILAAIGTPTGSDNSFSANFTPTGQVPEPGTVTLLGVGALAIAVGAYRRKRAS